MHLQLIFPSKATVHNLNMNKNAKDMEDYAEIMYNS